MAEALLQVRDLHGWYGESHILHGMSFEVARGEVVTPAALPEPVAMLQVPVAVAAENAVAPVT